jgi:hypothetical protein
VFVGFSKKNSKSETKINYKIIARVNCIGPEQYPPDDYLMENIYDYDHAWTIATGSLLNKPYVNMDKEMVFGMYNKGGETLDSITEDSLYINIYRSTGFVHTMNVTNNYIFIKLNYTSKEFRFWYRDIAIQEN